LLARRGYLIREFLLGYKRPPYRSNPIVPAEKRRDKDWAAAPNLWGEIRYTLGVKPIQERIKRLREEIAAINDAHFSWVLKGDRAHTARLDYQRRRDRLREILAELTSLAVKVSLPM
jgi:hypothetical protein